VFNWGTFDSVTSYTHPVLTSEQFIRRYTNFSLHIKHKIDAGIHFEFTLPANVGIKIGNKK